MFELTVSEMVAVVDATAKNNFCPRDVEVKSFGTERHYDARLHMHQEVNELMLLCLVG